MAKFIYIPTSLAILLLTGGCYINKAMVDPWTYAPEGSDDYWTPTKYALRSKATAKIATSVPNQLEPLTLAELIDLALINNTQTAQTWNKARESAAEYGQTQSSALPNITGEFDYFRTREASFFAGASAGSSGASGTTSSGAATGSPSTGKQIFIESFSQWGPQLRLTYTVFDFGMLRATSEAARQALYFADYTHNREVQTVVQTITTDYYNVLYQDQLLHAYLSNVDTASLSLESADLGFKSGVKDVSDVLQARTQLLQYEIIYVGQKQQVQTTYADLLNDMGLPATLVFKLEQMPDANPKDDDIPNVDDLVAAALNTRPDYLAAQAEVISKNESLKAAKREVYPKINYLLDVGKTYFSGWINDRYDYTSAFTVSMPLFHGFYYKNNIKVALASKEEAKNLLKQMELEVIKDISITQYAVKVAFDTLKYSRSYLASAEEQFKVALEQYRAGTNNILNLMSAQSSLADARAKFVKATQEWYTSLANLAYAVGIVTKPSLTSEALL